MRVPIFRASRKVVVLILLSRFFLRLYFQLLTFNFQPSTVNLVRPLAFP